MLKIRDEIDLKELEKFGYELQEDWFNRGYFENGEVKGEYIYIINLLPYTKALK